MLQTLSARSFRFLPLLLTVALLALAGGCVARNVSADLVPGPETADLPEETPDVPEELVEAPRLPDDDGIPLSPEEKIAMDSTGELDAVLTPADMPYVELHFKFFTRKNRKLFERFLARSEPYLPYVRHVFKSRGIPEEVAYLAYVESGFNPNALSPAAAAGMWQFIPATGRRYGLYQDRWIDERRDSFKSTHAAAAYLLKLHGDFGDWLLAMAAYNAGEGKIARALAGTQARDFFGICRQNGELEGKAQLKDETMQYVPRFLAVTKIMRNLEILGFSRPDPARAHAVAPVPVNGGTDLRGLARAAGMSWNAFSALNPAFRRAASPPRRQSTAYVFSAQESKALAWLSSREARVYAGWKDYTVRKGETLAGVARRHGMSVAMLNQANARSGNTVKPGEVLLVPASSKAARLAAADMPARERGGAGGAKPKGAYKGIHEVVAGDTLYTLARQWGSSVDAVRALNRLSATEPLQIGQTLYIPGTSVPSAQAARTAQKAEAKAAPRTSGPLREAQAATLSGKAASSTGAITVKAGDTLYSLARANNYSVDELCAANNIRPGAPLRVGQELRLSRRSAAPAKAGGRTAAVSASKENAPEARFALVQPGDTLASLAKRNRTTVAALMKLNGLRSPALKQGQLVKLP